MFFKNITATNNNFYNKICRSTLMLTGCCVFVLLLLTFIILSVYQWNSIETEAKNSLNKSGTQINQCYTSYINKSINISNNISLMNTLDKHYPSDSQSRYEASQSIYDFMNIYDDSLPNSVRFTIYTDNDTIFKNKFLFDASKIESSSMFYGSEKSKWVSSFSDRDAFTYYYLIDASTRYRSVLKTSIPNALIMQYIDSVPGKPHTVSISRPEKIQNYYIYTHKLINESELFAYIPKNIKLKIFAKNLLITFMIFLVFVFMLNAITKTIIKKALHNVYAFIDSIKSSHLSFTYGDNDSQIPEEFTVIQNKLKTLSNEIKASNQQIIEMTNEKNKIELELWQSRFNPHLLYNSLSAIKWNLLRHEQPERSAELIDLLTSYYRKTLNRNTTIVTLSDEISYIAEYIKIMEYSHNKKYNLKVSVADSLLNYPFIKHTLQPIVENSVLHGLHKTPNALITIIGRSAGEYNILQIIDNGCGMTPDKLAELNTDSYTSIYSSYGIRNTRERLNMYFCDSQFKIDSVPGEGTTVTIKWKIDT